MTSYLSYKQYILRLDIMIFNTCIIAGAFSIYVIAYVSTIIQPYFTTYMKLRGDKKDQNTTK